MKKYFILIILIHAFIGMYSQEKNWNKIPTLDNETSSNYFNGASIIKNKKLIIENSFYINQNIHFIKCRFYMKGYSSIELMQNYKAQFDSCIFVACDTTMWRGISIEKNSILNLNKCRLYDALIGVKTNTNATYHIIGTDFNRNWKDIEVGASMVLDNNSTIVGSHLFCHNEITEYYGNTPPRSGGRCWAPHREDTSFIGIDINRNKNIRIGDSLLDPMNTNIIEDKNYGIYCKESGLEVVNNTFNNIHVKTGISDTFGDAIYYEALTNVLPSYSSILTVNNNVFNNIKHAGIFMTGAYVQGSIFRNKMDSVYHGILAPNLNNTSTYLPVDIMNNHITYHLTGIGFSNIKKLNLRISTDTIISTSPTGAGNVIGVNIQMTNISGVNSPIFRIDSNRIYNGKMAINIALVQSSIDTNKIRYNRIESRLTDKKFCGINLFRSSKIRIQNNSIVGRSTVLSDITSATEDKKGIYLNESLNNMVNCNMMDYLYKGFTFTGICTMKNLLFGNEFRHLGYHIFGNPLSTLGDQLRAEDSIAGPFHGNSMVNIAIYKAIYNRGTPFKYARILIVPNFNPALRGDIDTSTTVLLTTVPIGISTYSCSTSYPLIAAGGSNELSMDASIVISNINNSESIIEVDKLGLAAIYNESIYDILKTDSTLLTNDTINDFYTTAQNDETGKLYELNTALNTDDYNKAEEQLISLNNESYIEQANTRFYNIFYALDKRNATEEFIEDTIPETDTIVSIAENQQSQAVSYYQLQKAELDDLLDLASLCPYRYGQAVYSARVLINAQYGYENKDWDDEQLCVQGVNFRRAPVDKEDALEIVENKNIEIFPNPTSKVLNFSTKNIDNNVCNEIVGYTIVSGGGKKMSSIKYEQIQKQGAIDISNFTSGLYIIYFECSNHTRAMFKFVIKY